MKKRTVFKLCAVFAVLFIFSSAAAQEPEKVKFYEVIKDDSAVMFFNKDYYFTEKNCAAYKRYTRIDEHGDFLESFTDVDTSNQILGKGWYTNGKKNGHFEVYYANGQVK